MIAWRLRWKKSWSHPLRTAAQWWTAYSTQWTVADLRKQVEREDAAIVVLENLEAIEDTGVWQDGSRIIRVRLTLPSHRVERYMLDLTLTEMGIGLIDLI